MFKTSLLTAAIVGIFGTACANVPTQTAGPRRFDPSLYVKAQEPTLSALDPSLRSCVARAEPVILTWEIAGDGHVADVAIAEPEVPTHHEHDCLLSKAFTAHFAAPANGKAMKITHAIGETVAQQEVTALN